MSAFAYGLVASLTRFLLPLYVRVRVEGLENVPASGALVLAANHLNDADPLILMARIQRRMVFLAKVELFRVPVLGLLVRACGAIAVRRNEADLAALRRANETLKQGLALALFPEGRTSTSDARLVEAWPGAALVALRGDAPVLPVAITGSQRLKLPWFLLRFGRRQRVGLKIGTPFVLPRPSRIDAAAAQAATQQIMETIAALLPVENRGYYGGAGPAADAANTAGERAAD